MEVTRQLEGNSPEGGCSGIQINFPIKETYIRLILYEPPLSSSSYSENGHYNVLSHSRHISVRRQIEKI